MKRGGFLLLFLFVNVILFSEFVSATLGISPAIKEFDFVPNTEYEFVYNIISDNPDKDIEIFIEGDLEEFATLNKEKVKGAASFKVKLKLPFALDRPGAHALTVGVRELPEEDQFIGTAIDIRGSIKVFVPYPGQYAELDLRVPDGNVNEEIPVELLVMSRGEENIFVDAFVDFFTGEELVNRMTFIPAQINASSERYFRKTLDTAGFKPSNYLAIAYVNYGELVSVNKTVRIGSLFVNVTNFTDVLPIGGIQKFDVDIESKWNGDVEEVFADVNISNDLQSIEFRTPSVDLRAWKKATLTGFVDTTDLEGEYNVDITLNYAEQQTFASGTLFVSDVGYTLTIIAIVVGVIILIAIAVTLFIVFRRKRKKKG